MQPKFIKQPNALFIRFGQYTGQILSSSISDLKTTVTIRVASFYFSDIIDLDVPYSNFQYFSLLRALIDDTITFVNIGVEYKIVSKRLKKNIIRLTFPVRDMCGFLSCFLFLIIHFHLCNRNYVYLAIACTLPLLRFCYIESD